MLKILKNDEKVIFRIKGSNSAYIIYNNLNTYRHLKYPKAVNVCKFHWHTLKIKETSRFSVKRSSFFGDTL